MRLLLVEDDSLLGDGIRAGLRLAGHTVDWVKDGVAAQLALEAEEYSLVVLDLGLPRLSGLELLRWLRQSGETLPVLILTARDTVADRVKGLDSGADDYLVKPFDLEELAARVRSLLRRSSGRASPLLKHGEITLDPAAHRATRLGLAVELPPREFAILQQLLEQSLYGWNEEVESNAIEVHIHHLRKKLGAELIRTVRGVGYMIDKQSPDNG